jgi:hypothetical protein
MAWIAQVPPSPRHPKPRRQVRYQDGRRQRSAGIFTSPKAAETVRRRIEQGLPALVEASAHGVDATKAQTLFGDYVEKVWWLTWKAQHPDSAYQTGKRIEKRIPAHLRQPSLCRPGRRPDRRLEGQSGCCRAQTQQCQQLSEPARDDPQRRSRQRLSGPLPAHAPQPRRAGRRRQEPARDPPGGLGHPQPARSARWGRSRRGTRPSSRWRH